MFLFFLLSFIVLVSVFAFFNNDFLEDYMFSVWHILKKHQYYRLLTSIFLHVGILHLAFNLYTFYVFGSSMEQVYGWLFLLLLFLGGGIGANLITLFLKRKDAHYSAVGASGGVSAIIFSAIFLLPGIKIGIFPIPFMLDAWLFALLYVFISIYAAAKEAGNIGHEAHLGGALLGMLASAIFFPVILFQQTILFLALTIPIFLLLVFSYRDPFFLQKWLSRF